MGDVVCDPAKHAGVLLGLVRLLLTLWNALLFHIDGGVWLLSWAQNWSQKRPINILYLFAAAALLALGRLFAVILLFFFFFVAELVIVIFDSEIQHLNYFAIDLATRGLIAVDSIAVDAIAVGLLLLLSIV